MSNIDETAKTLILNTIQNVFTESAIEEPIVEETPAEKLRREVAEKIAHDLQERKEATKMYKSGDATTSDEKESTIKEKNINRMPNLIKDPGEVCNLSAIKSCPFKMPRAVNIKPTLARAMKLVVFGSITSWK